jgi:hypothetical protein
MHMPRFKHGYDEQGLVSIEQCGPTKYCLQEQTNFFSDCEMEHKPLCEQLGKQLFVSMLPVNMSMS